MAATLMTAFEGKAEVKITPDQAPRAADLVLPTGSLTPLIGIQFVSRFVSQIREDPYSIRSSTLNEFVAHADKQHTNLTF